jgi:hypothetical protein
MKKLAVVGITVLASLVIATSVFASAFVNPPESSGEAWGCSFPYERNLLWTFDNGLPESGPTVGGLTDVDYEGYADPSLWNMDYVTTSGPIQWYDTISGYAGRQGLIGLDNREGTEHLTATVTFHLANIDRAWPIKHLYKEIVFLADGGVLSYVHESENLPQGSVVSDAATTSLMEMQDGFERQNVWYEYTINPSWEEVILTFHAKPGYIAVVDSLHIATECVPEPATMMLLGSLATGLFGVAGIRRKK